MRKYFTRLLAFLLITVVETAVLYAVFMFIANEGDPAKWHVVLRVFFAIPFLYLLILNAVKILTDE